MNTPTKILYTARVNVTGGRDGKAVSDDGNLVLNLGTPVEMGGAGGNNTNPEQLFAAGFGACFLSALNMLAGKQKIAISDKASVQVEVGIGTLGRGFGLAATLTVILPGMDEAEAYKLVEAAHAVCPYSNATRGNIPVKLEVRNNDL